MDAYLCRIRWGKGSVTLRTRHETAGCTEPVWQEGLRAVVLLAATDGIGESLLRDNADEAHEVSAGADEVVLAAGIDENRAQRSSS